MATNPGLSGGYQRYGFSQPATLWQTGLVYRGLDGFRSGLYRVISARPELECIRKAKNVCSPLLAAASAVGLALRHYRMYRFAVRNPSTSVSDMNLLVNRNMEQFGSFRLDAREPPSGGFRSEFNLLLSCAFWTLVGNSVQYEFGYRWFHQTQYGDEFKSAYLDFLDVKPFPVPSGEFAIECERASPHSPSPTSCVPEVMPTCETTSEIALDIAETLAFTAQGDNDFSRAANVAFVEQPLAKLAAFSFSEGIQVEHLRHVGVMFSQRGMRRWLRNNRKPYTPQTSDVYTRMFEQWEGEFIRRRLHCRSYSNSPKVNGFVPPDGQGYCQTIIEEEQPSSGPTPGSGGMESLRDPPFVDWSYVRTSSQANQNYAGSGLTYSLVSGVTVKSVDESLTIHLKPP